MWRLPNLSVDMEWGFVYSGWEGFVLHGDWKTESMAAAYLADTGGQSDARGMPDRYGKRQWNME